MRKKLILAGVPALAILVAGFAIRSAQSSERSRASIRAGEFVENLQPASESIETPVHTYLRDSEKTLLYRFEVEGDVTVRPPADTNKAPQSANFTLTGTLAIGADENGRTLIEFRNVDAKGRDVKKFQGLSARADIDSRGRIQSVTGPEDCAVFLSHLEFVLPDGASQWEIEGRDPAGDYTAKFQSKGVHFDGDRKVLKITKKKKYGKPSTKGGFTLMPDYTADGYFDMEARRLSVVELSGTLPDVTRGPGIRMTGTIRMSFAFLDEENIPLQIREPEAVTERKNTGLKSSELRKPGTVAAPQLQTQLTDSDPRVRANAVLRVSIDGTEQSRDAILRAAKDKEFIVRAAVARALTRYRSQEKVETALLNLLADASDVVRYRAAGAFLGTNSARAREALQSSARGDKSDFVRKAASQALHGGNHE